MKNRRFNSPTERSVVLFLKSIKDFKSYVGMAVQAISTQSLNNMINQLIISKFTPLSKGGEGGSLLNTLISIMPVDPNWNKN